MTRLGVVFCRASVVLALALNAHRAPAAEPDSPPPVYIKAGHLFDATGDNLRDNVLLVVDGQRISRVAPAAEIQIPAGAEVVDLSRVWVLPGLIDCHTHLSYRADQYDPINEVKLTPFNFGFYAVVNANRTLQ